MPVPVPLRTVAALIGFTAVVAQVVLMREFIVVFYGNELSLGLILASWLLWTAAGSGVGGRLLARWRRPRIAVAALEATLAIAFPLTIWAVRATRSLFGALPGEALGPGAMVAGSLAALSAFCFASGALFAAVARMYSPAAVYLFEAAGSAAGGLVAAFALIPYLSPFWIAAVLAVLNLAGAAWLAPRFRVAAAALAALFVVLAPRLEALSLHSLWQGLDVIATRNSRYGNIAVAEMGGSRGLYENGLPVANTTDQAAAEEAVHFALLEHPAPRSLLLIGGGVNGSLREALRHSTIERADYVELDPAIIETAARYFPSEWAPIAKDPRVRVHNLDGRLFLRSSRDSFDVIIVNLPDPQTAQLNRFYTAEFFREAARRLAPGGVFSFQVSGAENYISPELGAFLRCIHRTLGEVFPEVCTIPGETVHFIASTRALTTDPAQLIARLRARGLKTMYVSQSFLPFRMRPERVAAIEAAARPLPDTPMNRDSAPIAYYFDNVLWSVRFHPASGRWFQTLARVPFWPLAAGAAALGFLLLAPFVKYPGAAAASCTAATGFTIIGLELLLLIAFQTVYGYVYYQLAILIAAFMGGMAVGSWAGMRSSRLATVQLIVTFAPLLLYAAIASRLPFSALALGCGFLGGFQFAVASSVYFARSSRKRSGTLYALDLVGACAGGLLASAWLVPVFGLLKTAALMAAVNLAPTALAAAKGRENRGEYTHCRFEGDHAAG
jgi:spermidine synthase